MAYGYARGGRGDRPDPRDLMEDAARAAGMSVQEWLERAASRDNDDRQPMPRRRYRAEREDHDDRPFEPVSRRSNRRFEREDSLSEDRVAKIIDDAMGAMQDSIRASEAKTASVIAAMEQHLGGRGGAPSAADRPSNAVQRMVSDLERGIARHPSGQVAHDAGRLPIHQLEERISSVLSLIEKKARGGADNDYDSDRDGSETRRARAGFESDAFSRDQRPGGFPRELPQQRHAPRQSSHHDFRQSGRSFESEPTDRAWSSQSPAHDRGLRDQDIRTALEDVRQRIGQVDRSGGNAQPNDYYAQEIASLRASLHADGFQSQPNLSGLERRFETLDQRLDQLSEKISALRPSGPRDLRGQRSFDSAVSKLKTLIDRSSQSADDERLFGAVQALEQRLDALVQSSANQDSKSGVAALEQLAALEKLERITGLEQKFDGLRAHLTDISEKISDRRGVEPQDNRALQQIGHTIDDLKRTIEAGVRPQDDARVIEAFHAIERRMEAIERTPAELVARVDQLQSLLAAKSAPAQPAMPPDVEHMLQKLAGQIDRMQNGGGDDRAFDKLHQDIQAISSQLTHVAAGRGSNALAEFSQLERSVTTLLSQIDGLKSEIGATAEMAVRRAAQDVLDRAPRPTQEMPFESAIVQRQLSDIHVAQQEADKRTAETLDAVHGALSQVVNRLVDMEQEMKKRQELPVPATVAARRMSSSDAGLAQAVPQPLPPLPVFPTHPTPAPELAPAPLPVGQTPLHLQEALAEAALSAPQPSRVNPLPPLGGQEPPASAFTLPQSIAEMSSAPVARELPAAATVAEMRAQRLGVSAPSLPASKAASANSVEGALATAKGMLSALKLGKDKLAKQDESGSLQRSVQDVLTSPIAAPSAPLASPSFDLPLEPGSGRPKQILAPSSHAVQDQNDPKASFISAARRAAQVAADQSADALALGAAPAKDAANGAKAGLKKKHALLLGLAALIVAVGATLTFMKDAPPPSQAKKEAPAPTSSLTSGNRDVFVSRRSDAPQQTAATRQVLPPPIDLMPPVAQTKQEDRVTNQAPRVVQPNAATMPPDLNSVGSIASEGGRPTVPMVTAPGLAPQKAPAAANDQLLRFEGIAGSERLKDAARAGDPSAFIELGSRYLDGKGAPRDPKTAAMWFERAADFGSAPAQYRLGALYREGKGVERNTKIALKHFQAAAEAGNARAMHNTAVLLAEGANGGPDYAGATEWFKKAAEFGIRDSQYNLAILYARGLGISQDLMASYAWFSAAAGGGDDDAAKKRDEVGARLSPERLQQAKTAAQSWTPKTPDPSSNEVAVPSGGWDSSAKQVPAAAKTPVTQRRI